MTDIVTLNDWTDGSICAVVEQITLPFRDSGLDCFVTEGKDRLLPSKVAIGLRMALHELCTNAAKYGALSSPEGRVRCVGRSRNPAAVGDLPGGGRAAGGGA